MSRKVTEATTLDLIVSFGQVSIGDKTARIGVAVDRSILSVAKAEKNFCEKRIQGKLVLSKPGYHPDQGSLPGMEIEPDCLEATFDVKSFSTSGDEISFGLTFLLGSIEIEELVKFAKRVGRLQVLEVAERPAKGDEDSEEDNEE